VRPGESGWEEQATPKQNAAMRGASGQWGKAICERLGNSAGRFTENGSSSRDCQRCSKMKTETAMRVQIVKDTKK
jgi:hypothetical protein